MKNVLDVQLIESEKIDFKKLAKNSARDHNPEGNVSGGSG
jgi:hypothetical protein